ncbi:FUSC family protein [Photobacterium chitinilyticum]|uniref:FUSC family protein n=1 Tax=Photobacterium chitinilyticum TaxID=2485123 RepID=UPI003D121C92
MAEESAEPARQSGSGISSLHINNWLFPFCLSEKFKFATRVAISLTLAFLIPMALGWPQPSTAATTVMLIASTGSRRESLAKGTLRVLGTIVGAVIGLVLVGFFAQDRMLYMLSVSLIVAVVFYIRSAYLADPTLFMLTGVMILMMFNGGDAEGAFLYGLDRTYMTVFGVVVYTLVGVFVFPPQVEQNLRQLADELGNIQSRLFSVISQTTVEKPIASSSGDKIEPDTVESEKSFQPGVAELIPALYAAQDALESRYNTISTECSEISAYKKEWDYALLYYRQITELLLFAAKSQDQLATQSHHFIDNYQDLVEDISQLFQQIPSAWERKEGGVHLESTPVIYNSDKLQAVSHLVRGTTITSGFLFSKLDEKLTCLISAVSCIDSVTGRMTTHEVLPKGPPVFNWWDAENAKSAIKVVLTYWLTGIIWILFNPPGGYNFVIFCTLFVSILSYLPIHPVLLLILFSLGFIFSVPAYVFILPQLSLGSELAVFIFIYTFVGFYLFKGPITIFFLIGMFTLGISNDMIYHFGIILTIVTLFYLVVFMVVFSYYFPFSSRPEHLFLVMRERFCRHVCGVITCHQKESPSFWYRWRLGWHLATMKVTVRKLKVWGSKVNTAYYEQLAAEDITAFCGQCELLCHHLLTLTESELRLRNNPLVMKARAEYKDKVIPEVAHQLASLDVNKSVNADNDEALLCANESYKMLEKQLDDFFEKIEWSDYSKSDIAGFYIFLNLKKSIFDSLIQSKASSDVIHWKQFTQSRF